MSVLTVRNLDPDVKARLRVRAAQQGISMEEATRRILTRAANESDALPVTHSDLGSRIQARFSGLGEVSVAPRNAMRASPFGRGKAV